MLYESSKLSDVTINNGIRGRKIMKRIEKN
jgi:hypothetical protein